MLIDNNLREQVKECFEPLTSYYTLKVSCDVNDEKGSELISFLSEFAELSPKVECELITGEDSSFTILKDGVPSRITFRSVPSGHEFTSLILAILNLDGKGQNLPDEQTIKRIESLNGLIEITTYMLLTCPNCPEVVQAFNIMAIYNHNLTHIAIDGASYPELMDQLGIEAVPTVYADGEQLSVGRLSITELLDLVEARYI